MSKFEVGQRVRCVEQDTNCFLEIGKEYTVRWTHPDGDVALTDERLKWCGFKASRFEPLPAPPPAAPYVPAIGDVVECLADADWEGEAWHHQVGQVLTIKGIYPNHACRDAPIADFTVDYLDGVGSLAVWPISALKLLRRATPSQPAKVQDNSSGDGIAKATETPSAGIAQSAAVNRTFISDEDIGTTPTDRRMRQERIDREREANARAPKRAQEAEQLRKLEGVAWGEVEMNTDRYTAITGHRFEEE